MVAVVHDAPKRLSVLDDMLYPPSPIGRVISARSPAGIRQIPAHPDDRSGVVRSARGTRLKSRRSEYLIADQVKRNSF